MSTTRVINEMSTAARNVINDRGCSEFYDFIAQGREGVLILATWSLRLTVYEIIKQ